MKNLDVKFDNCFGIGKLSHKFSFEKNKVSLIYAPNGTMKTSFAKTFDLISKNDPKNMPVDRVYKARETKYKILADDSEINPDNIFVINSDDNDFDGSSKISAFLASKELKNKYDEIYKSLNLVKADFVKKLKTISKSTDCEKEILNTFSEISKDSFFEVILALKDDLKDDYRKFDFRYNDIFDSKGKVLSFLEKNSETLSQYILSYKDVVSKSNFFKENSGNTFGTYQANEILKSISDNSFFNAGHKFILGDNTEINDSETLKELVNSEINKILSDKSLKDAFDKVDKIISNNVELRAFHNVIQKNNLLLLDLDNYYEFKKEVWISFLSEIKIDTNLLVDLYAEKKLELEEIISEAKKESDLWGEIINTFNSRFFVPFEVSLVNKEDVILKKQTANLEFSYADRGDEPIEQDKNSLLSVLSKGEQRAYFILQFLFELESRKTNADVNLLILDDISDSFDYKNKFAIIEYIKDINELDNFRTIILTHNFDFYRTIASRFSLHKSVVYMAVKNEDKIISLKSGNDLRDVFSSLIKNFNQPIYFISLIAFVRNLVQYSDPKGCEDFIDLTNCLHLKKESLGLKSNHVFNIFSNKLFFLKDKSIDFGEENIVDLIFKSSDYISGLENLNEIFIENKIVLAIAIRLKAEYFIILKIKENGITLDLEGGWNQTRHLCDQYKINFPTCSSLKILEKVNLMTPENIHINAFMYEPLIDMSVKHLVDLYGEISNLCNPFDINRLYD
jgi:energy-coupling factor transporter ATP-binding protein EcfA2